MNYILHDLIVNNLDTVGIWKYNTLGRIWTTNPVEIGIAENIPNVKEFTNKPTSSSLSDWEIVP